MRLRKLLIVVLTAITTVAQAETYQNIGFSLSEITSVSDYTFWGPGLRYEFGSARSWGDIGAEVRLSYNDYMDESDSTDASTFSIVPFEVGIKYTRLMNAWIAPYAAVGVGVYSFADESDFNYDPLMGFYGAMGCEFRSRRVIGGYFQLKYTSATGDAEGNGFGTTYGVDGIGGEIGVMGRF
jgi:hypothetical protein